MSLVTPFKALRPAAGRAAEIIAPPYDVLSSSEAIERAAGKPWSFLHISKPEIDLPAGTDIYSPAVYAKAAENMQKLLDAGVITRDDKACYYVYRIIMGSHVQTGIVAAASVIEYDNGRIKRHEFTRPDKEDDRVRQIEALNAQTGPVFLAYPDAPAIDAVLTATIAGTPDADATADDGIRHTLWVVRDDATITQLNKSFDALPALYIADGHHRSAAASRVAASRRSANPHHTGDEPYNYFLSVIFPAHALKIMDYNRVVCDLNGLSKDELLAKIAATYSVTPSTAPVKPAAHGEVGMYLAGQWYQLKVKPELIPADPVERLDVSLLTAHILTPILGIADLRRDKRIDFVGGIRGLPELEKRVNSGEMAVAFAMCATTMNDLMSVADAGQVMPPKSTWFEPKLADGMASHAID
ncbi:DUF1015 domain-containing protein [Uliginosibacterium sp. 31-12]|uniref:DUF1015 domain-containing protein n=1 Tax=Uliginosibacterium sp. 31-12 TaxID=3062781 RepID=UPI0026E1E55E|nr:DUF1015 domain-containing protein [Uliginosibacterium sp. 31-12]MDO6385876.1 DUF1015 domain-containing protein [Uliginosibacterium sp. 31-12]